METREKAVERDLVRRAGASESWAKAIAGRAVSRAERLKDEHNRPPMDKDSLMFAPVDEWDRTDLKGHWGDKEFVRPSESEQYRRNYEKIDWSR